MVWKMFRNEEARRRRRAYGIHAFTGANGSGKSAAMVWETLPDLEAGRAVLSTLRFLDYENPRECDDDRCASAAGDPLDHFRMRPTEEGREAIRRNALRYFFEGPDAEEEPVEMESLGVHRAAHPGWIPWTSWPQLLNLRFGAVCADEITGILEARSSTHTLPTPVLNHLQQLRRASVFFRYTMPDWAQADSSLRRPTQLVTVCRGYFSQEAPMEGDQERLWTSRRLYRWKSYDAQGLTQLTEGKRQELSAEVKDWHWGPDSPAWAAYDTFAPVLRVGVADESGRCIRCGGRRRAQECRCDTHARAVGAAAGAPSGVARATTHARAGRPGDSSTAAPAPAGRRIRDTPTEVHGDLAPL